MKILIVEDDKAARLGLSDILKDTEWDIEFVLNGEDALRKLAGTHVLVNDMRLPGMSGLDLLKEGRRAAKPRAAWMRL